MLKSIRHKLFAGLVLGLCLSVGSFASLGIRAALAEIGTPPGTGPGLVDGVWLNGIAGGTNYTFQSGISAAGTTQATATQLPAGIFLVEIDTAAASTGVNLPPCIPGTQLQIYNNGAQTVTIYPAVANNPLTSAQDTINNATSITLTSHSATSPACAKAGNWFAS